MLFQSHFSVIVCSFFVTSVQRFSSMITSNRAHPFHGTKLLRMPGREFSRELLTPHNGYTLSAICAIQSLITNCTNNATRFLAGHRKRIASEHAFQSLRRIEDTQPHIITHRAYQQGTMQGGTLPHRIATAVFKPMISMGSGVSSPF